FQAQWYLNSRNKFDIIHVHFANNVRKLSDFKAKHIVRGPVVVTLHGFDLQIRDFNKNRIRYHDLTKICDAFIVNTPYLRSILTATLPMVDERKIHTIPVGLDTAVAGGIRKKEEDGLFKIVFCGRMIPLKGPDLMVEIVSELVHGRG